MKRVRSIVEKNRFKGVVTLSALSTLSMIFFGFLKSRATIIEANQKSKLLIILFRNENWFNYLISYSALSFLLFSESETG